ncbi:hypothetical protein EK21DRAFT_58991 [Setomelanomma holmii]|uniref:Uncharacterized protein n=1 Tax=Setomelanomma holmii TaxID=210430 RepID=A0A9P4LR18_9PLEO|nr:hypothetical protein EK21DRAFT_58991 [Setomelanomma holmii]
MINDKTLAAVEQTVPADASQWEMINHADAVGFHDDRILLILGPLSTAYPVLMADIPKTAALLVQTSQRPLRERKIRMINLDNDMVTAYFELGCTKLFTAEYAWGDLINLAVVAEILQDKVVETHAIAVLKKKARLVVEAKVDIFTGKEYEIAWKVCRAAAGGVLVWQILNNLRQKVEAEAPTGQAQVTPAAPAALVQPSPTVKTPSSNTKVAVPSISPEKTAAVNDEDAEKEGKHHPIRQPRNPPTVEALRAGKAKNFVWPNRNMVKKDG